MKKRNCRLTPEEREIKKEATRLRRKTDAQLVEEVKNAGNKDRGVKILLNKLAKGECSGIGGATVYKLSEFAKREGLV